MLRAELGPPKLTPMKELVALGGYIIQINVIWGDGSTPLAYAWQAGIIANLVSDETHHIPMPSRVEVLSDQDAILYWPKPLCQREAQEVVDAII